MDTPINDGGPIASTLDNGEVSVTPTGGLSIRDYFAAMALGHIPALIDAMDECPSYYNIAEHAYGVADAMLAARKGGKP
jgi:hypothetical protein